MAHYLNRLSRDLAIEQSLDAALELNDVLTRKALQSPKLEALLKTLLGSSQAKQCSAKELLSDARFARLSRRAGSDGLNVLEPEKLENLLAILMEITKNGLADLSADYLMIIRDFCLGLNRELVAEASYRMPEPPLARRAGSRSFLYPVT